MAKSWSIEPHGEVSAIPAGAMSIHNEGTHRVGGDTGMKIGQSQIERTRV